MAYLSSVASFIIIIVAVIIGDRLCADVSNVRQPNNNAWSQLGNSNANVPNTDLNSKSTTPWPALGQSRRQQQSNLPQSNGPPNNNRQPMWVRPNNGTNWVRNTPTAQKSNIQNTNTPVRANTQSNNGVRGSASVNSPIRNSANYNTNFLNGERGSVGSGPQSGVNQRQTSFNPSQNQRPSNLNINNGMRGPVPSGLVQGGNLNQGSNNKNTNIEGLTPLLPLAGGGGNKIQNSNSNNNGMMGATSGSSYSDSGTSTRNQNQEPNSQQNNGEVEDYELREFSEELLTKDTNNAARYVTINLQGMTTSRSSNDVAPLPLLSIDSAAYTIPSIEKLMLLYNNYILETNQNEVYTAQEKIEENNLLDTILSTSVMQHTRNFLIKKGKIGKDPKDFKDLLRLIWFNMYSRGGGRIGSSGFEHIFLAELKNNQVSGLHNWLYFNEEEKSNRANYLGYMKKIDLGTKGAILKYHFTFHNVDKPVGSMFIGTSPELELALYSTCFILRADRICPLKMGGSRFIIRTYTYRYRGKNMIGSAFPEI